MPKKTDATRAYFADSDRLRTPVRMTIDPEWLARAKTMADATGLPLSRWIEQLIRAEFDRQAKRSK
jgi:hypothetical protein